MIQLLKNWFSTKPTELTDIVKPIELTESVEQNPLPMPAYRILSKKDKITGELDYYIQCWVKWLLLDNPAWHDYRKNQQIQYFSSYEDAAEVVQLMIDSDEYGLKEEKVFYIKQPTSE